MRKSNYEATGYALAMRVMQSDLYPKLDGRERSECDAFVAEGQGQATQGGALPKSYRSSVLVTGNDNSTEGAKISFYFDEVADAQAWYEAITEAAPAQAAAVEPAQAAPAAVVPEAADRADRIMARIDEYAASYHVDAVAGIDSATTPAHRKAIRAAISQAAAVPEGWRLVPVEFIRGFGTLAHNYSLTANAPDYYHGVERDAFRNAYARCGHSLASLRSMLEWKPPTAQAAAVPEAVGRDAARCGLCGESEAFTGACGGGRENPKALCFEGPEIDYDIADRIVEAAKGLGGGDPDGTLALSADELRKIVEHVLADQEPASHAAVVPEDFRYLQSKLLNILHSANIWETTGINGADKIRMYVRDLQDEYAAPSQPAAVEPAQAAQAVEALAERRKCGHPLGDTRWCPDCEWEESRKNERQEDVQAILVRFGMSPGQAQFAATEIAAKPTAQAAPAAVVPEGWKLVPIEPTPAMVKAMATAWSNAVTINDPNECIAEYKAALLAAPEALAAKPTGKEQSS